MDRERRTAYVRERFTQVRERCWRHASNLRFGHETDVVSVREAYEAPFFDENRNPVMTKISQ